MIELCVPFTGDKDFFFIRPTTFDMNPPRAIVSNDYVTLRVSGQNLSAQAVKSRPCIN
jgi:hypothetical protein